MTNLYRTFIALLLLVILYILLLGQCKSNNGTGHVDTVYSHHTDYIIGKETVTKKEFYHEKVNVYTGTEKPVSTDSSTGISVINDSVSTKDLTLFINEKFTGSKLFAKYDYRLKVPVKIETLRVDTLKIETTKTITIPPAVLPKKRFVIFGGLGYGATTTKLEPYIGVGVGFKIAEF